MANPFHYGTPAAGENFVGRKAELGALTDRVRNGINVVLISPRRYGKTSLLLRAQERLEQGRPKAVVVTANVLQCKDAGVLAGRLLASLYRSPEGAWNRSRDALSGFIRRFRINANVGFDDAGHPTFAFSPRFASADLDRVVTEVYSALAAEAEDRPVALILDEFQAITRHGAHLPGLLKGIGDEYPKVSLVVAGSQQHLMERLVTDRDAPLYNTAQRIALGPIDEATMSAYLSERATRGGKPMGEGVAARIFEVAGPVPDDIQHLAFEVFTVAPDHIALEDVDRGLEQAVAHESGLFAEQMAKLSPGQFRVLTALAISARRSIFSSSFASEVGLAGGQSVKKAIDALDESEVVIKRGDRWAVANPFLAAWLRAAA